MARGKNIPPLIRRVIIEQYKAGIRQSEIARQIGMNRQTIHRVIERHKADERQRSDG